MTGTNNIICIDGSVATGLYVSKSGKTVLSGGLGLVVSME